MRALDGNIRLCLALVYKKPSEGPGKRKHSTLLGSCLQEALMVVVFQMPYIIMAFDSLAHPSARLADARAQVLGLRPGQCFASGLKQNLMDACESQDWLPVCQCIWPVDLF